MHFQQCQAFLRHRFGGTGVAVGLRQFHGTQQALVHLRQIGMAVRVRVHAKRAFEIQHARPARCQFCLATLAEHSCRRARQCLFEMPDAYPFGHERVPGGASRLFVGWGQTFVHAMDPWQLETSCTRPRLRSAGRSLPKSHSRGPQANGGEAGAGFDVLPGLLDPVAPLPAFPYRPAVTRLTQSLSFDSALLSRGAPFGARCVPTSSSHSTAPEPARAKRCAMRIPARHGILWPGFRNTWRTANPARDAEIIYQLFRGRNYFSRWRLASKPRCLDSNFRSS